MTPEPSPAQMLTGKPDLFTVNLALFAILATMFYGFNGAWVPQAFVIALFLLNALNVRYLLTIRRVTAISVPLTITALLTVTTFISHRSGSQAIGIQLFNLFVVMNIMLMGCVLMSDPRWRGVLTVLACIASVSAAAAIVLHFAEGLPITARLVPLGRAANPIPGAGGLFVGFMAALTLLYGADARQVRGQNWLRAALAITGIGMLMTQSRTPLGAATVAVICFFMLERWRTRWPFIVGAVLWVLLSAAILFEDSLKSIVCSSGDLLCRPSNRLAAWVWVRDAIIHNPVFGLTPVFRFDDALAQHPHNGLFGLAMFYGIPTALAFVGFLFAVASVLQTAPSGIFAFSASMLVFSMGYMATDLSNAFSFANMHLFFLWLPIALGVAHVWSHDAGGGAKA